MGLARSGILFGKRFSLIDGRKQDSFAQLDEFTKSVLSRFGFLRIAKKLVEMEDLSDTDVELLVSKAGLPVLMKLCSLAPKPELFRRVRPAIVLPIGNWFEQFGQIDVVEFSKELVCSCPYPDLVVGFDGLNFNHFDFGFLDVVSELRSIKPFATFLGPNLDSIVSWIARKHPYDSDEVHLKMLEQFLVELREAGITEIDASSFRLSHDLLERAGFATNATTDVRQGITLDQITVEILKLRQAARSCAEIGTWMPTISDHLPYSEATISSFQLLRILAIGSIAVRQISFRRASSRYLNSELLRLAFLCGANDFGYGAIDDFTASVLNVRKYEQVRSQTEDILPY